MRKLSLMLILPLLHLFVSITIFKWQFFPPVDPNNAISFWFALNAPVLLLVRLAKQIATIPAVSPYIMGGVRPIYFVFLVGGLGLWFFVGRTLEKLRRRDAHAASTTSLRKLLLYLLSTACGIRLIFIGLEWILPHYPGEHQPIAMIVDGSLILVWSLALILLPGMNLLRLARKRAAAAEVGPAG
jgi:hypothetical protein